MSTSILLRVSQVSLTGDTDPPHRRVLAIFGAAGNHEWHHSQQRAIQYIENSSFSYYLIKDNRAVRLVVGRTAAGEKFLKAALDGDAPDLLLQLPARVPAQAPTPQRGLPTAETSRR